MIASVRFFAPRLGYEIGTGRRMPDVAAAPGRVTFVGAPNRPCHLIAVEFKGRDDKGHHDAAPAEPDLGSLKISPPSPRGHVPSSPSAA